MSVIGKIESLWRYPVKSMRGEALNEAFLGSPGSMLTAYSPLGALPAPAGSPT